MRISGGSARGRVLRAPKGVDLRPTEERVRQALFNVLAPSLEGSRFLDLFCGTGAVGLEAISRGAAFCCFADKEPRCLTSAQDHHQAFGFSPESAEFMRADYAVALGRMAERGLKFDFVFIDPPYDSEAGLDALKRLGELAILNGQPSSRVVLEHQSRLAVPESMGRLSLLRQYPHGNSTLSFYVNQNAD